MRAGKPRYRLGQRPSLRMQGYDGSDPAGTTLGHSRGGAVSQAAELFAGFSEPGIDVADYEQAARMHNLCRARGIAGSAIDFLICAVAQRRAWHIFTTNRDFE